MRSRLVINPNGSSECVSLSYHQDREKKSKNARKEDLTLGGYIQKYGGIKSQVSGEVFTSERSYKEHLKRENLVIKDW